MLKELAKRIDGNEYGEEFETTFLDYLKSKDIVVIYGRSDDCVEFGGAYYEEVYTGDIYLDEDGVIEKCEEECKYFLKAMENAKTIKAEFTNNGFEFNMKSWTEDQYETFRIYDDGDLYCTGVLIMKTDLLGV